MKCFERLVMAHINSSLPACLDPLQFAYRHNRSTVAAISLALHSSLEHLDNKDTYIRLLLQNQRTDHRLQKGGEHTPIYINRTKVERVKSIKFLGVTITDNLSWTSHVDVTAMKAQHLFFLRQLRKFGMSI
eukprot:g19157.t1